jgi:hypothetical protein
VVKETSGLDHRGLLNAYLAARLMPFIDALNRTAASVRFNSRAMSLGIFLPASLRSRFISAEVHNEPLTVVFFGIFDPRLIIYRDSTVIRGPETGFQARRNPHLPLRARPCFFPKTRQDIFRRRSCAVMQLLSTQIYSHTAKYLRKTY